MLSQVSRQSALCLMTATINQTDGVFGRALSPLNRKLLEKMFTDDDESRLGSVSYTHLTLPTNREV